MGINDAKKDYWIEAVRDAFEDVDLVATEDQIEGVAGAMEIWHENYGLGFPTPESPYKTELEETKRALKREREKMMCEECNGKGRIREWFGPVGRGSDMQCFKCNGEGYLYD